MKVDENGEEEWSSIFAYAPYNNSGYSLDQTSDGGFIFSGTMKRAMWQVGNAVPVKLAFHIALALKSIFIK